MTDPRPIVALVGTVALGACVGSFLNVVAYRLPRACMSVVKPRSRCPKCARFIAWYDNLPVLSWFLLRGRCRGCGLAIAARYPAVEAGTALLFWVVARETLDAAALTYPANHGAAWGLFALRALATSVLVALALIDYDYEILPDRLTLGGAVAGPLMAFVAPALQPTDAGVGAWRIGTETVAGLVGVRGTAVVHSLLGAAACAGFLWLVGWAGSKAFRKEAMGLGDVKMAAAMGAVLGFWSFAALTVAVFSGALVGIVLKSVGRGSYIRFGPFLALGTWAVLLRGTDLLGAWLALVRPG